MTNNQMQISILTTVYDGVQPFLDNFFQSLKSQTYKNFNIILVNDCCKDIDTYIKKNNLKNFHVIDVDGTPARNRITGIKECINHGSEIILFADSDDTFKNNRVEIVNKYLIDQNFEIMINDINICSSNLEIVKENFFSKRIKNKSLIKFKDIQNYNFCGLSNSAIKTDILKDTPIIETDPFDWMLFSCLLLEGPRAIFTNETCTNYRQHNHNFIGIGVELDDDRIRHAVNVKAKHYKLLQASSISYKELSDYFLELSLMQDKDLKDYYEYCHYNYHKYSFWWEEAKKRSLK